jgi:leucyl aminopeptidase
MVRVELRQGKSTRARVPLLVWPVWGSLRSLEAPAVVKRELQKRGFRGQLGERADLGRLPGINAARVCAYGVGEKLEPREALRRVAAAAVALLRPDGVREAALALPEKLTALASKEKGIEMAEALAEGAQLAAYRFTTYSEEKERELRRQSLRRLIVFHPRWQPAALRAGLQRAEIATEATFLARNLVNTPSQHMTPRVLAKQAKQIAGSSPELRVKVWGPREVAREKMEAFAAVGRGAEEPLAFIHLTYLPPAGEQKKFPAKLPKVVLVGKGLTFDSGGYSLKPPEAMETMKIDMAGAAAVLGIFSALPRWRPLVEVHGLIAACENLISGRSMRPGDIVRTRSGKTVEILNTDAEGRLTLADALSYAAELKPQAIIDLATLTGACIVALGENIAGLFSNDEQLATALEQAARRSGEPVWRMPLREEYRELLRSELADLKNIATQGRFAGGGAITAALFLAEFVQGIPWVHLDIAGPAYTEKSSPTLPYLPAGASGFGVRTLLRYLREFASSGRKK